MKFFSLIIATNDTQLSVPLPDNLHCIGRDFHVVNASHPSKQVLVGANPLSISRDMCQTPGTAEKIESRIHQFGWTESNGQ